MDRVNRAFIAAHRVLKSASPSGKVQTACMWSGNTSHASIPNGRSTLTSRTAARNRPTSRTSTSDPRSTSAAVKKTCAPGSLGLR
jgi:hypothetical protein